MSAPARKSFKVNLVPLRPDGCRRIGMMCKSVDRITAQRAALRAMPSCRLHDDEPRLLPIEEDARYAPAPEAAPSILVHRIDEAGNRIESRRQEVKP